MNDEDAVKSNLVVREIVHVHRPGQANGASPSLEFTRPLEDLIRVRERNRTSDVGGRRSACGDRLYGRVAL